MFVLKEKNCGIENAAREGHRDAPDILFLFIIIEIHRLNLLR